MSDSLLRSCPAGTTNSTCDVISSNARSFLLTLNTQGYNFSLRPQNLPYVSTCLNISGDIARHILAAVTVSPVEPVKRLDHFVQRSRDPSTRSMSGVRRTIKVNSQYIARPRVAP